MLQMTPTEAEIPELPSNAVALRPSMAVGHALGVDEIVAQVKLIQDVMHRVMKEGEHFGCVPGCGTKKTLLQPGAQKLTMTFRLAPEYEIQEVNLERGHKEYRVICTLKSMGNGSFVGQGVGCCSSMESKYRWRGGARKCPECGKETIIKGKAEYGGGWLCFAKKGGCGFKWPDGAKEIEDQSIERVENDNPADTFNTVLKMAKKRAFVDATITATAASDIFTQDIGDDEPEPMTKRSEYVPEPSGMPQEPPDHTQTRSGPKNAATVTPAHKTRPLATEEQRAKLIALFESEGKDAVQRAWCYFVDLGAILPTESLADLPLRYVPVTAGEVRELGGLVAICNTEGKATRPSWITEVAARAAVVEYKHVTQIQEPPNNDDDQWFLDVIVPIPRKGQKRDAYLKHPDTIRSLYEARHGQDEQSQALRQRLWGFVNGYEAKGWVKRDGTQMPPSDADINFAKALAAFDIWFQQNHPDEKL